MPFNLYDMYNRYNTRGIAGKTANYQLGQRRNISEELGKEFSWLYGGRPLERQEISSILGPQVRRPHPVTARRKEGLTVLGSPSYDPRFGTIGGMPGIGQGPNAMGAGATAYKPIEGFGTKGTPGYQPYQEVGPTPAAKRDVQALGQLPYDLMDQYRRIADQGIYGPAGMNQIVQAGILPQKERTKAMTGEALTAARTARQQTVTQGARMLAEKLGGQFASQPGLAMKLMGDQIIAPTLAKEMEAAIDLKVNETNMLNALDGAIGDLLKANQESKMMGLAGIQDIMGFLQQRVADRWWDLSMENKFGWSPERTAAAGSSAAEAMAALQQKYNLTNQKMQAVWQDWLDEQRYIREEYGMGGSSGSGGSSGGSGPVLAG